MNTHELQILWSETLRSPTPNAERFEYLAQALVDVYASGDAHFRQHIKNRFNRVAEQTGVVLLPEKFDLVTAHAFIADEVGFTSWNELIESIEIPAAKYPILFQYAIAALWRGDFTALENAVGGPDTFDDQIKTWLDAGYFDYEPETMAEAFAAACMLGHPEAAAHFLDAGVDPYTGMRTGLAGFHYAASSGRLNVIKLLVDRKIPMEVENMYGGTVLGQALWSAINEHTDDHAEIVETLINGGAYVWPDTLKWWEEHDVPSSETKKRVAEVLRKHGAHSK